MHKIGGFAKILMVLEKRSSNILQHLNMRMKGGY
jgi:hypothetical protein